MPANLPPPPFFTWTKQSTIWMWWDAKTTTKEVRLFSRYTMSCQNAYLQSVSWLVWRTAVSAGSQISTRSVVFLTLSRGFLPVDSLRSMPVIKPLLAGALTHSHLWIELKLSHLHLVVTAGMCRLIVWSSPKHRSCIVDWLRLKPQRHTKKRLSFSSELLRVSKYNMKH